MLSLWSLEPEEVLPNSICMVLAGAHPVHLLQGVVRLQLSGCWRRRSCWLQHKRVGVLLFAERAHLSLYI